MTNLTVEAKQAIWTDVLGQMKLQQSQATYDAILSGTAVLPSDNGLLLVGCPSELSRANLDHRLRRRIEEAASYAAGRPLEIQFVITPCGDSAVDETPAGVSGNGMTTAHNEGSPPAFTSPSVVGVDILKGLWIKHPKYLRFYPPYLAGLPSASYAGSVAFSAWQTIRDYFGPIDANWTPPLLRSPREMAAMVGLSKQQLLGVWRGCAGFDQALEEGYQFTECCQSYRHLKHRVETGIEWPQCTKALADWPEGRPTCRHFVPGALWLLANERLAYVEATGKTRDAALRVQVYRNLPLLTPAQAETLPDGVQDDHRRFISQELGVNLSDWQALEVGRLVDYSQDTDDLQPSSKAGSFISFALNSFFLRGD